VRPSAQKTHEKCVTSSRSKRHVSFSDSLAEKRRARIRIGFANRDPTPVGMRAFEMHHDQNPGIPIKKRRRYDQTGMKPTRSHARPNPVPRSRHCRSRLSREPKGTGHNCADHGALNDYLDGPDHYACCEISQSRKNSV
jgi:hypothetical protein